MIKMNKKIMTGMMGIITLIVGVFSFINIEKSEKEVNGLEAVVLSKDHTKLMLQDQNNIIYTLENSTLEAETGSNIFIEYTGLLDKNKELQVVSIVDYGTATVALTSGGFPTDWQDNGIFSNYYALAYQKVKKLSLEEKIAQILLVRYPENNALELLKVYPFGGYVFFEKDFKGKTKDQAKNMIANLQKVATIPILTAVDEEGGSVVRVSSNPNLADSKFESPSSLYQSGGFDRITKDTITKSTILKELGLNLNLAPVVDVVTDPNAYMYNRSLGQGTELTATYAKTVIQASKGTGVSYTLKHFPGYGNNADTHTGSATDNRTYDDILNEDLPPFETGVAAGAEAVLVSHNIVSSIDANNPASLSPSIHNLLRNHLDFTGIIMTDDLSMGATSNIDNAAVKAILAGNDLIITTDYKTDMTEIKQAIQKGTISETTIDKLAMRVIAWKYYKGLLFENQK